MLRAAIFLLAGLLAVACSQDDVCTLNKLPNQDPTGKMSLGSFPTAMELNIEQTMLGKQKVQEIHMDYSQLDQKMHMAIVALNNRSDFWIDAKRHLFLGIGADDAAVDGCVYKKLDTELTASFLGFVDNKHGNISIGSPEEALHVFNQNSRNLVFVGNGTVRGIPTNMWQACQVTQDVPLKVSVIFHFSDYSLTTPYMEPALLAATFNTSIGGEYVSYRYDYVNIKPLPDADSNHLLPPPEVYCSGESYATNLPKLPIVFSFKTEILDLGDPYEVGVIPTIRYSQQEYIEAYGLFTRIEQYEPGDDGYSSFKMVVHDFNLMISYEVDMLTTLCKANPITSNGVDAIFGSDKKVRMRNPQEFFHLTRDYQYSGVRRHISRGIECDVWVHVDSGYQIVWWFATLDWKKKFRFENPQEPLPVSIEIVWNTDPLVKKVVNVYEYSTKPFNKRPDYSSCFSPDEMVRVVMKFSGGSYHQVYLGDATAFTDSFVLSLLEKGGFTIPTRIVEIDVQPGEANNLLVTFVILGKPLNIQPGNGKIPYPSAMEIYQNLTGNLGYTFIVTDSDGSIHGTLKASSIKTVSYFTPPDVATSTVNPPDVTHPLVSCPTGNHPDVSCPAGTHPYVSCLTGTPPDVSSPTGNHPHVSSPTGNHPHVSSPTGNHSHVSSPTGNHPHVSCPTGNNSHVSSPTGTETHLAEQQNGSSGYSSGAVAGIAIGLLVVGILIGLATLFLIQRYRTSKRLDDGMELNLQSM